MKRNNRTMVVLGASIIAMLAWLAGNGCKSNDAQAPSVGPVLSAKISVSSHQITAGNVVLNNTVDQPVSIQNTGSTSLNLGQIAQRNPLASPFSIVNDGCSSRAVAPSSSCSFKVRFNPTSQGVFNDDFDIPSNASNASSVTVAVSGSGKALRVAINQVNTDGCPAGVLELIVNVTDQNNAPVAGLATGDFQLKENGVLQPLQDVSQTSTTIPLSVAMLLDYSGTMDSQIPTMEAASINFVGALNPDDEAAVIKFEVFPQLMQDFTGNTADLTTAINTAPSEIGSGGTYLYDALWFAVETTAPRLKHKAIVLISDGKDENSQGERNVSVKTLDETIAHATENEVSIFAVGMGDVDSAALSRMATGTGGQYYYVTDAGQLADVYQAINDILLGHYSVEYISSLHGGSLITLEIEVTADDDREGIGTWQAAGCP